VKDIDMARRPFLSDKKRMEWQILMREADRRWATIVEPTELYADMYAHNASHWAAIDSWTYDAITANLVYANVKSLLPKTLMRHPHVRVRPRPLATGRVDRIGGKDPGARWRASLAIQQLVNWRVQEFDFKREVQKAQLDDYLRGWGVIRHGYSAVEDVSYFLRDRAIEFNHHQHVREGWPFAVYWPLEDLRLDPLAKSIEELQWCAFRTLWRLEDLKKFSKVVVPDTLAPSMTVGSSASDDTRSRLDRMEHDAEVLGRVPIWEIWDRRTHRVLYWSAGLEKEIGVEDWPLDFEGLPISILASSSVNGEIFPVAEQSIVFTLQQQLNKLLSLILVYAKRGVPIIGVMTTGMEEEEKAKIMDAEILEIIQTNRDPNQVLKLHNLQPVPQTLLLSIELVKAQLREVTGQGRIGHGARENVESGTEAAGIIQGMEVRSEDRRQILSEFFARVVRKDFQVLQQTMEQDQVLDIIDIGQVPTLLTVSIEDIKDEYEFGITVGSMDPKDENAEKRDALMLAQLLDSSLGQHLNPAYVAQYVVQRFGLDESLALAPQTAALLRKFVDEMKEQQQQLTGGTSAGTRSPGAGNGAGVGAALDASKIPLPEPQEPV
jgi:hypothetical protein